LNAAEHLLASNPRVIFLLVGEGAEKQKLREVATDRRLTNVIFVDQKPRAQMPGIIRASDACLVTLRKTEIFTTVIPTKLLEFMSCGRPVILAVDGQARKIVEAAQAGLYVEPENTAALVAAISKLVADPDLRQRLGANGRRWTVDHLSRAKTAERYIDVLGSIQNQPHPAGAEALNDRNSSEKIAAL
jgi:glycosyltransferase involved in cell wall biosynthesis